MFEALGLLAAKNGNVHTILWVIAGFLIGPGGVSIFK